MVQNQHERNRHDQQQQNPHDDVQTRMAGLWWNISRQLMVSAKG
jgi:hypothetical protein